MTRKGILAGGNFIRDYTKLIDDYPLQETLANISEQSHSNGGSPYNLLIDLARLGADFPLEAVGLVGNDEPGRWIIDDCKKYQINSSGILITDEAGTSYTDVMLVKKTGKRTFFHYRGANALLAPKHFRLSQSQARFFHLGYLLLLDTLDEFAGGGRTLASYLLEESLKAGFINSVDLVSENSDRFRTIITPSLPYIDYLFLNEFEAEKLTGIKILIDGKMNTGHAENAASVLINNGVRKMVFLHTPEGALAKSSSETYYLGSVILPGDFIKGTTGAGDAFAAGILLGLHGELPVPECLRYGICSAASCLSHPGCSDGIKSLDESLALGNKYGFREPA